MKHGPKESIFGVMKSFIPGHNCKRKQTFIIQLHIEIEGNKEGEIVSEVIKQSSFVEEHGLMQLFFRLCKDWWE